MNESQFTDEVMILLFGEEYEYLSEEDCNYKLALSLIKNMQKD